MVQAIILLILSFLAIWFGAGLIVSSVEDLSYRLKIPSFATSFFVLGLLTSIPEIFVGLNSVIDGNPEIFVGNLIGASLVLFVLVIPLLAVLGNGIKITHQLDSNKLLASLVVVTLPSFYIIDKKITMIEAIVLILTYLIIFYAIEKRKGILEKIKDKIIDGKTHFLLDFVKIIAGIILVFFSSNIIVDTTILLSNNFNVTPYIFSLLMLSIGTNLPEISLALRSVSLGKKEIAFGDYIGSAVANTLIFGSLTLIYRREILLTDHFLETFIFILIGLGLFYHFTRSKNDISRREGIMLLLVYIAFLVSKIGI